MIEKGDKEARYLGFLLSSKEQIVGVREVTRALQSDAVEAVFIARDADLKLVKEIRELSQQKRVPVVEVISRQELGRLCRIEVGAAVAALGKTDRG